MKDIKHFGQDFHSVAWVTPQAWDFGGGGGGGGTGGLGGSNFFPPKFNQFWCVSYSHEWHVQQHKYFGPRLQGFFGKGLKVKYH